MLDGYRAGYLVLASLMVIGLGLLWFHATHMATLCLGVLGAMGDFRSQLFHQPEGVKRIV